MVIEAQNLVSSYGHLLTLQLRLDSFRGADPVTTILAPGRYY